VTLDKQDLDHNIITSVNDVLDSWLHNELITIWLIHIVKPNCPERGALRCALSNTQDSFGSATSALKINNSTLKSDKVCCIE